MCFELRYLVHMLHRCYRLVFRFSYLPQGYSQHTSIQYSAVLAILMANERLVVSKHVMT